jgi:hypothetical protein
VPTLAQIKGNHKGLPLGISYLDSATPTFSAMVEVVRPALDRRGRKGGQAKLSVEDPLLVALEYWREYRSQFHIGVSWGLHETTVGRIIRKVENLLVNCGTFRLPSQRQLYQPGWEWNVMMVDVGEIEIERPKKTATLLQRQTKMAHPESASGGGV